MSIAFDTLTLGRPCLSLVASSAHSCGRPPKEEQIAVGGGGRAVPDLSAHPLSLANHTERKREDVDEAASFVWQILCSFKSAFRPSYLSLSSFSIVFSDS